MIHFTPTRSRQWATVIGTPPSHWQTRFSNSTSSPTRTGPKRSEPTQRGDSPLVPARRLRTDHIACCGTPLDMLEQKMSMVPYQEVRSTSQTLWEPRRMFSQVAMRRPPEPPDLGGGERSCHHRSHPQWAGIGITRMTVICSRSSANRAELFTNE